MVAGDFEIKWVLSICGFLGNFFGRATFIVYCGVNILVFSSEGNGKHSLDLIATICGWIAIAFGFILAFMKICAKSDSLLTQELDTYLEKHKADDAEGAAQA